jgi:dipeptidyl aminopeptidase/acylaminoacyl peptidase
MAAAGGSYGGYLTAWILGHTDRFKALVVHSGPYDLMAQFASDATRSGAARTTAPEPWVDPEIDQWSPNRFAANFKTPLIMHGEKDYRAIHAGLDLYGVLTAKGVPADLRLRTRTTGFQGAKREGRHTEVLGWLDRWLAAPAP